VRRNSREPGRSGLGKEKLMRNRAKVKTKRGRGKHEEKKKTPELVTGDQKRLKAEPAVHVKLT